jgi:succinoglycan biosynthesis transport protein ExoP
LLVDFEDSTMIVSRAEMYQNEALSVAENSEPGLGKFGQSLKRNWLPTTLIFVFTTAAITSVSFIRTPVYQAEGILRFKGQDTTSAITGLGDELGQLSPLVSEENPINTEIGVIKTVPIIEATIAALELRDAEGAPLDYEKFLENLQLANDRGTDILRISYRSHSSTEAERIVDTLMQNYLDQNLLENRAETTAARGFIEQQIPAAEARVLAAETALRDFKEKYHVVDLAEETTATVEALGTLQIQITDLSSQLADTEAQFSTLQAQLGQDPQTALMATALSQSAGIQQVLAEYQQVETALAAERVRFQDQHPRIVDLESQRAYLEGVLNQRVDSISPGLTPDNLNLQMGEVEADLVADYIRLNARLEGLNEQASVLLQAEASHQQRAQILPRLQQEQRELERRLTAAQATYAQLLERLQEVRVAENQNIGNVRVIQPAMASDEPVAPSKMLNFIAGSMLGILLAAAAALLLESRDQSIRTVEDVKQAFRLPVLGIIPTFGKTLQPQRCRASDERLIPRLVVQDESASLAREAYHMLRSNLKYLNSDNPPQVIGITSSLPCEGKSTVASNLAAAMAQTGQRVLLIDADLHHPIQHWIWNYTSRRGLSDVLVGEADLSEVISEVMPNLTVLCAGVTPPNPAALLDSHRMTSMLQEFKPQYDFVILDTPTLSGGASAPILGKWRMVCYSLSVLVLPTARVLPTLTLCWSNLNKRCWG